MIQLERPEASIVFRYSREKNTHHSNDLLTDVGQNDFQDLNLNYFSLVYPTYSESINRNVVVSLNAQEAYDFTQQFTGNFKNQSVGKIMSPPPLFLQALRLMKSGMAQ
ncbi:MAG: hypothetical protein GKR87_15680 [Kiritimatiellae bacterium]|nr:hypothetical protein [Kiritimatiellia bacterium]